MLSDRTIFHHYLHRLTLAQGGGRQLFLSKVYADQMLDLQTVNFLLGKPGFACIADLIEKKESYVCAEHDSRLAANNVVSEQLKKIKRTNQFIEEEKGTQDLFLGWPFVSGLLNDLTPIRCPLLLFPIALEVKQKKWYISLREDEEISFNPAFLLIYYTNLQKPIDHLLLETDFDEWEKDSTVFRTRLYQLLRDTVDVNFNSELFGDQLKPFEASNRQNFLQENETGKLKLHAHAVLGIFPQASSQLVSDYKQIIEKNSIVNLQQFFSSLNQNSQLTIWKEENNFTILPTDSYQDEVQATIKSGKSLVIQGPPGSGKSQMISNIIADSLANGKRILMVCQKRVALDVVYKRLGNLGLENFIAIAHDFRASRNNVSEKIKNQIEDVEKYREEDRNTSIIKTERQFVLLSRRIEELTDFFEEYKSALFDESSYGISAKELYLTIDKKLSRVNLRQEYSFFDVEKLKVLKKKASRYLKFADKLEHANHPWKHRISFSNGTIYEKEDRLDAIQDVLVKKHVWQKASAHLQFKNTLLEIFQQGIEAKENLNRFKSLLSDKQIFLFFNHILKTNFEKVSLLWLDNKRNNCLSCFEGDGIEAVISSNELGNSQQVLQSRMEAERKSFFHLWIWKLFSKEKLALNRLLIQNKLKHTTEDLLRLEKKIDNRLNFEHHATSLKQTDWLIEFPNEIKKEKIEKWFSQQHSAIEAAELYHKINLLKYIETESYNKLHETLDLILTLCKEFEENQNIWQQHLSSIQITRLFHQPNEGTQLIESLEKDFNDLVAYDQLKSELSFVEKSVIDKTLELPLPVEENQFIKIIENSIKAEWLEHIERKFPILTQATSDNFELLQQELQQAIQEKLAITPTLVKIKLRERVYQPVQFNRLNNAITYRDLYHQVSKKRMRWPLRKIIQQFKDETLELIPCWLTTPEAASAIFTLEQHFDLVIFDEASQCFAEQAFPAMFRGKQVLITGDQKQLKPNDLYKSREQNEVDNPDAEIESLLNIAERYLPAIMLKGHYRSKHEGLLHFSNLHFYKNQLSMLADYSKVERENPLQWIKVNGIWEKQSNEIEAEKIAELLLELHNQKPEKSIGVITFNIWQQELILLKTEKIFLENNKALPNQLFIKNIENVQGDERDIIIFSIGYAPDKHKKINHHFGSLSVEGGENRLNVAITRAKEKIFVVSSVEPEELSVNQTLHQGPKLLRDYLHFVKHYAQNNTIDIVDQKTNDNNWYLARMLENNFVKPSPWPMADLLAQIDKVNKGLILTDDDNLALRVSVKAYYGYWPTLFQHKSWKHVLVNSRQYFINKKEVESKINRLLN